MGFFIKMLPGYMILSKLKLILMKFVDIQLVIIKFKSYFKVNKFKRYKRCFKKDKQGM